MCNPAAVAIGFTVADGVLGFTQEKKAAKEHNKAQKEKFELNRTLAIANAKRQTAGLARKQLEVRQANTREMQQITKNALKSAGLVAVSAGAGGVSGTAVTEILGDFVTQEDEFQTTIARRGAFQEVQFATEQEAIRDATIGRISSLEPIPVAKPSLFNAALGIAGGVIGSYNANSFIDDQGNRQLTSFGG